MLKRKQMPIDLLFVRNGISEGANIIDSAMRGIYGEYGQNDLLNYHNSRWRLTDMGKMQAKSAGKWIRENFDRFDAHLTGEFNRSLETAAFLGIKDAKWIPSVYLRPRDWDETMFNDTTNQRKAYQKVSKERIRDSYYWSPPNGESISHVTLRIERVIHWIRSHVPSDGRAIIVTHKDVMECFRIRFEHILQLDYENTILYPEESNKIHQGSILQYTRRNPGTGEIAPIYKWMRVITPWLGHKHMNFPFKEFNIRTYTTENLLDEVNNAKGVFDI